MRRLPSARARTKDLPGQQEARAHAQLLVLQAGRRHSRELLGDENYSCATSQQNMQLFCVGNGHLSILLARRPACTIAGRRLHVLRLWHEGSSEGRATARGVDDERLEPQARNRNNSMAAASVSAAA